MIIANTSLTGNHTSLPTGNSMTDFTLLKAFKVNCRYRKAPRIIEVLWHPPILNWVKCNTDGAALGYRRGVNIGCFAFNIGIAFLESF